MEDAVSSAAVVASEQSGFGPGSTEATRSLGSTPELSDDLPPAAVENERYAVSTSKSRAKLTTLGLTGSAAALLVLSFPNFGLWPLAWVGLVPLLLLIARSNGPLRALLPGWLAGTGFFFASCYWLTYSMIHYGGIPVWLAYLLLIPAAALVGIFPGLFSLALAQLIRRWGSRWLFFAPVIWIAAEGARLAITGQLWNAIGYSQSLHPTLIQVARFGGVYAVGFMIVSVNAAVAFALVERTMRAAVISVVVVVGVALVITAANATRASEDPSTASGAPGAVVVALQPNVPMDLVKSPQVMQALVNRHLTESERVLDRLRSDQLPRVVIWPESPMNFSYGADSAFRDVIGDFARRNQTAVLFNSQERTPGDGFFNSALLINEEGRLIAQYDKIRLMPFGEYVPLPQWLPGSGQVKSLVGEFTPGTRYTLMPVANRRAGVFICIEAAYPSIARTFTAEGADVLVNLTNDGYLGPTAVIKQDLGNAIFRAVENGRPLLRVTNTGISAYITPAGVVKDATPGFEVAARTWTLPATQTDETFYTRHGDAFVATSGAVSLLALALSFVWPKRKRITQAV